MGQLLWRAAKPLLSEKTKQKIRFASREETFQLLVKLNGLQAAQVVDRVMQLNRSAEGCRGNKFPSELCDDDADLDDQEGSEQRPCLRRAITKAFTRQLAKVGQRGRQTV